MSGLQEYFYFPPDFVWLNWQICVPTVIETKNNIGSLQSTYQASVSYQ
jgi:hypothetical protein